MTFFGLFHVGMTTTLSMSGLISQRTVRFGRGLEDATSFILPADADLGKLDPAAPRRAGRSDGWRSTLGELLANVWGDFFANSCDKNRNLPPPGDVEIWVLDIVGGAVSVGDCKASCVILGEGSDVVGVVKLCQLRHCNARRCARTWR